MRTISPSRFVALLFLFFLPLSLSGCLKDIFGGEKNVVTPEIIKVKGHTDKPKEPVKEVPAQQPAEEKKSAPCPSVEERFLPQQLNPQNPECLMPAPPPQPRPQAEPPHASAAPARREASVGSPDFSYRDAIITEDTAWHGEVLIEGSLTVAPQTTLTVQAGTIIRFRRAPGTSSHAVLPR